jgi:hypothetical protein
MYVAYNPSWSLYWFALGMSIFFSALILYAVYICYPKKGEASPHVHWVYVFFPCLIREEYLAPIIRPCFPGSLKKHVATDWLILNWLVLVGCIFCDFISLGLLLYAIEEGDNTAIFDWSTSFIDMIFFTVGGMYFVAGSYPVEATGKGESGL